MATTPNSITFQPAFKRVAQQGRHDDTFAVIAMLTNKPMEAIFRQAEGLGLPKIGPFHAWIDGDMIAKLLAAILFRYEAPVLGGAFDEGFPHDGVR